MSINAASLAAPGHPTGDAGLQPAAPAGAAPPGAAVPADDEVLPVAELLRLLEQGSGFAQALAGAVTAGGATAAGGSSDSVRAADSPGSTGASCAAQPGAAATTSPVRQAGATPGAEEEVPCDIATLLRILESQPSPPVAAAGGAASSAPAGGVRPRPANGASAADEAPGTDAATAGAAALAGAWLPAATPVATTASQDVAIGAQDVAGDAATSSGAPSQAAPRVSTPAVAAAATAAAAEPAAMARTDGDAGTAANAGIAGELRTPDAKPAPADPAGATLALAQSLRSELPAAAPVERMVQVPVRDPAWPQAVAAEIHFLADRKVEAATLRLSPEHLGPVEVHIDVRDGNVSVSFGVAHGDTQAALEQALPRLREMLAAAGLHLGQASVQQEARQGSHNGAAAPAAGEPATEGGEAARARGVRAVGLVDEYV